MAASRPAPAPFTAPRIVVGACALAAGAGCTTGSSAGQEDVSTDGLVVAVFALAVLGAVLVAAMLWARSRAERDRGVDGRQLRDRSVSPGERAGMPELESEVRALSALVRQNGLPDVPDFDGPVGDPGAGGNGDRPVGDPTAGAETVRASTFVAAGAHAVPVLEWPPEQRAGGLTIDGSEDAGGVDDDGDPEPFGGSPPASADGPPVGMDGPAPFLPAPDVPAGAGLGSPGPGDAGRFTVTPGALQWAREPAEAPAAAAGPPPLPVPETDAAAVAGDAARPNGRTVPVPPAGSPGVLRPDLPPPPRAP